MAHDYAKRSNSAKRPAARKNSPAPPPPPKRPIWPALAVLVLVAGLGYGLYQLMGVSPDPQATQQSVQQAASKPVAKPKPKPQPKATAKADDGYKFYKLLPESEVIPAEVEAYKSTPKSAADYSRYLLQAGSFRRARDADSLRAKLLLTGMPNATTSKVVSANGSVWYRVRVGPFASRSKLNKAQDQLVRMNLQPMEVKL
ncbi:MAG: SPOR domain-containing protein [Halopseudomonas sp.]